MQPYVHNGIRLGKLFHVPPKQNLIIQQVESMTHQSLVLISMRIIETQIPLHCFHYNFFL